MFVSVVPYSIAVIIASPWGYDASYRVAVAWARLMMASARRLCRLDYAVSGTENLPDTACVFMLKHSSAYETIAELTIVSRQTWVLKHELTLIPIFGWALRCMRPIAINRAKGRKAVQQVIDRGREVLANDTHVMIFPEGTRIAHGLTRRYGISGFALAAAAGVPIVPIAHDAGRFWPRRGILKKPGTVQFIIGKPTMVGADEDLHEAAHRIQMWIEAELRALDQRVAAQSD